MIRLTRLNRAPMVLNSDLIVHIEVTPDTVISLTTGETIMVLETSEEVVEKVLEFRRSIFRDINWMSSAGACAREREDVTPKHG